MKTTAAEGLRRVEREIRQAKAEALGRVGERLSRLLARLAGLDHGLDKVGGGGTATDPRFLAALDGLNRVRDEAACVRHHLIIQARGPRDRSPRAGGAVLPGAGRAERSRNTTGPMPDRRGRRPGEEGGRQA